MTEEAQVFRGDGPAEGAEAQAPVPKAKAVPQTILAKNDLPAGEPVGEQDEAKQAQAIAAEPVTAPVREPEPDYNFEIDPQSLWTMPEAMKERLSNLSATATIIHQQLDEQERQTARVAKALRALH